MSPRKKPKLTNDKVEESPFGDHATTSNFTSSLSSKTIPSIATGRQLVMTHAFASSLFYQRYGLLDTRTLDKKLRSYEYPTTIIKVTKPAELDHLGMIDPDKLSDLVKGGKMHKISYNVIDNHSHLVVGRGGFTAPLTDRPYKKTAIHKQFGSPPEYMALLKPCYDNSFTFNSLVGASFAPEDLFPHLMSSSLGVALSTISYWQGYSPPEVITPEFLFDRYLETSRKDLFDERERNIIRNYYIAKMVSN